jgi:hypothetical protein
MAIPLGAAMLGGSAISAVAGGLFGLGSASIQKQGIENAATTNAKAIARSIEAQKELNEDQLAASFIQQQQEFNNSVFAEREKMLLAGGNLGSRLFRKGAFAEMAARGRTPQEIGIAGRFLM